jgi:hypothetical protein
LIVVISIMPTGASWAGSITYTVNYDNRSGIPPIPQFDPALGQLIDVEASVTGSDTALYFSTSPVTSATYYVAVDPVLTSGFSFIDMGESFSRATYAGFDPGPLVVTGGYSVSADLTSLLESFYGTGQIGMILIEFEKLIDISPSDAEVVLVRGFDSGTETITYNFIAPEPPGLVMAGTAGLIGLGCWLWRRKPLCETDSTIGHGVESSRPDRLT